MTRGRSGLASAYHKICLFPDAAGRYLGVATSASAMIYFRWNLEAGEESPPIVTTPNFPSCLMRSAGRQRFAQPTFTPRRKTAQRIQSSNHGDHGGYAEKSIAPTPERSRDSEVGYDKDRRTPFALESLIHFQLQNQRSCCLGVQSGQTFSCSPSRCS
jgi:hypothetical protein